MDSMCKYCKEKNAIKYSKYSNGEFCSIECSRGFSTSEKRKNINELVSKKLKKSKYCECGDLFIGYRKFCSNDCLIKYKKIRKRNIEKCIECEIEFIPKNRNKEKCCSKECRINRNRKNGQIGGIKSSISQSRRSKNEIYFYELCKDHFKYISCNENIFNGWDADIIIHDIKVAVLWNGKWHYEKITKQHSINQVENRDKIKIKEIKKYGYKPYIIKDMGRENKIFVESEFLKFKKIYTVS